MTQAGRRHVSWPHVFVVVFHFLGLFDLPNINNHQSLSSLVAIARVLVIIIRKTETITIHVRSSVSGAKRTRTYKYTIKSKRVYIYLYVTACIYSFAATTVLFLEQCLIILKGIFYFLINVHVLNY